MKKCQIESCQNQATSRTDYCKNCGASINGWKKRRPAQVLARRQKLALYDARMATLSGKVVMLRKKA